MDGCSENLTVLNALIQTARRRQREIHLASLDISKSFDSVPYDTVINTIIKLGAPNQFIMYLMELYSSNITTLQFGGRNYDYKVERGARQDDPLSPLLFNLVIELALLNLNTEVGFTVGAT
jgi:hypothetical protein